MIIRKKDTTLIIDAPVTAQAKRVYQLMSSNYVFLSFNHPTFISIPKGSYIEHEGQKFYYIRTQHPTELKNNSGFLYEIYFDAVEDWLKTRKFYYPGEGFKEFNFAYTGEIGLFAQIVIDNANERFTDTWNFTIESDVPTRQENIAFKGKSIFDSINEIAKAFETEWWITTVGTTHTLHFGTLMQGNIVDIRKGEIVNDFPGRKGDVSTYGTRFYFFGSAENLPDNYSAGTVVNSITENRLRLPSPTEYIDAWANLADEDIIEQIVLFDAIQAKHDYTATDVTYDITSTPGVVQFLLRVASVAFSTSRGVPADLSVTFETGACSGMTFRIDPASPWADNKIKLISELQDDDVTYLPNITIGPLTGDKFIISGVDMPQVRISAAQNQLLAAGIEYVEKVILETDLFDCNTNAIYCKKNNINFLPGQKALLHHDRFGINGLSTRVRGFDKLLYDNYQAIYSFGVTKPFSRSTTIRDNINYVSNSGVKRGLSEKQTKLSQKNSFKYLDIDIKQKANETEVSDRLTLKANALEVYTIEEVDLISAGKASAADVETALSAKADAETVNTALAAKAESADVQTALAAKANIDDVPSASGSATQDFNTKNLSVSGNLSVAGSIDRYNQTELNIGDTFMNLGTSQLANIDGGIRLYSDNGATLLSTLKYKVATSRWDFAHGLDVTGTINATGLLTNSISKKITGEPIELNAGHDASTGVRVYHDLQVYSGVHFANGSYVTQGSIQGSSNKLNYTASSGHIFNNNIGINITDVSSWNTFYGIIETPLNSLMFGKTNNGIFINSNLYYDTAGSWRYIADGYAANYRIYEGSHYWYTSPAGLDNAIATRTTVMSIISSGDVGINTTSPLAKFDIVGSTDSTALRLSHPTAPTLASYDLTWSNSDLNILHRVQYSSSYYNVINIDRSTRNVAFENGNVLIGKTTDSGVGNKLQIEGAGTTSLRLKTTSSGGASFFLLNNDNGNSKGVIAYGSTYATYANAVSLYNHDNAPIYFWTNATAQLNILGNGSFGTPTFSSGFAGSGFEITNESGKYNATFDNLSVRGAFKAYEFQYEKIRVGSGSYWFSDGIKGNGITENSETYYIWCDKTSVLAADAKQNLVPFALNDIVRLQQFTGNEIVKYEGKVTYVDNTRSVFGISKTGLIGGPITINGDWARIGSTTDANRRGAVYITSSDTNSPYIDIINGLSTINGAFTTKVRLGKLDGITDSNAGLDGNQTNYYGLYSDNVHLKGHVFATSGKIGGANMDDKYLWMGSKFGIGAGVEISYNTYPRIMVYKNSTNYSNYYYLSDSNWGFNGVIDGGVVFRFGSTNEISGFSFTSTRLTKVNGSLTTWMGADYETPTHAGFGIYKSAGNYVRMIASSGGDCFIQGYKGGSILFNLNTSTSASTISSWSFDATSLYNGGKWNTVDAGVEINGTSKYFSAHYNAANYVKMGYVSSTDWGIKGIKAGATVFSLGHINNIAGFTFDSDKLYTINSELGNYYLKLIYGAGYTNQPYLEFTDNEPTLNGSFKCTYNNYQFIPTMTMFGKRHSNFKFLFNLDIEGQIFMNADNDLILSAGDNIQLANIPTHAYTGEPSIPSGSIYKMAESGGTGRYLLYRKS